MLLLEGSGIRLPRVLLRCHALLLRRLFLRRFGRLGWLRRLLSRRGRAGGREALVLRRRLASGSKKYLGGCQNYGPLFGPLNTTKRDHNFDNHPYLWTSKVGLWRFWQGLGACFKGFNSVELLSRSNSVNRFPNTPSMVVIIAILSSRFWLPGNLQVAGLHDPHLRMLRIGATAWACFRASIKVCTAIS